MSLYKLYGTGVTDNIASLDIVSDGFISAVQWSLEADLDADAETSRVELSFSSSSGFATNDTKSSVSGLRLVANGTPGFAATAANLFVGPNLGIPVKQGERLYLHGSGTSVAACTCWIHVNDGIGTGRPSGRRVRL